MMLKLIKTVGRNWALQKGWRWLQSCL